jgi:DtxR family Mn-dependent transcriptional regulator
MPTISVENYLKAIYHLQEGGRKVKTTELADRLQVSRPSVSNMLQSLASEGLVDYEPYRGARLTNEGLAAALSVIRKHRLIEIFLVETLDYEWDEVHAEAEQLEHSVSDKLAQRIDDFLGNPQFDPHGDPIPTADGQIIKRNSIPLNQAIPGQRVRIARVLDQQPDVLRHLTRQKLVPQTEIEVMEVLPFDGQMTVQVGENDVTISRTLASRLLVTPAAE